MQAIKIKCAALYKLHTKTGYYKKRNTSKTSALNSKKVNPGINGVGQEQFGKRVMSRYQIKSLKFIYDIESIVTIDTGSRLTILKTFNVEAK